jgi:signal transduction histidine kinase
MKSKRDTTFVKIAPHVLRGWVPAPVLRLFVRDGAPSIEGLDAAIRGFSVAIVVVLSLLGHGNPVDAYAFYAADPTWLALGLVLYNLVVIAVLGVPWRTTPGFPLFVLDWLVASAAILLTGGFLSPFMILYYALIMGAALRIGLSRSAILVIACAALFITLMILRPDPVASLRLPIVVVQVTSLIMVMFMSVGMKRAVEVEARKMQLEEEAGNQLRLLNSLTHAALAGAPNLEQVLRTVASASSRAVSADRGFVVLFDGTQDRHDANDDTDGLLIVGDRDPNPTALASHEKVTIEKVLRMRQPVLTGPGLPEHPSPRSRYDLAEQPEAIACVPFLLDEKVIGALFMARFAAHAFTRPDIELLSAISQQVAVAVRMARLYDMEREKAERSQELERLERDLLSMVSHELRTPLTAIKTSVGALASTRTSQVAGESGTNTEQKLLNNIGRSTDRLINLVNELLDLARLRAGRMTLNPQVLNMGEVLLDAVATLRPLFDARSQTLEFDLPSTGSPRWPRLAATADRRRIEQVIINLLSNANKYGPRDSHIVVGATPRGGLVKVFVRDEGPGIIPTEQGYVFDKFYRSGTLVENGKQEGTGLGLAIARSIVDLHGGHLGVHSRQGGGSTFYFTLAQTDMEGVSEETGEMNGKEHDEDSDN